MQPQERLNRQIASTTPRHENVFYEACDRATDEQFEAILKLRRILFESMGAMIFLKEPVPMIDVLRLRTSILTTGIRCECRILNLKN